MAAKKKRTKFESYVAALGRLDRDELMDKAMTLSQANIRTVPDRFRIIALGFAVPMKLDEVNAMLEEKGCAKLYPRSFWEATIIYALRKGYSYDKWKELCRKCEALHGDVNSKWFSGEKVRYNELEAYVKSNSDIEDGVLRTNMYTQNLDGMLEKAAGTDRELQAFLKENIGMFSDVRERARYYFCKYLYYYINRRIESYLAEYRESSVLDEERREQVHKELKILRAVSGVDRKKRIITEEEKREKIAQGSLSYKMIFDQFNEFFACYISMDWIDVMLDEHDNKLSEISVPLLRRMAEEMRKGRKELKNLKGIEVLRRRLPEKHRPKPQGGRWKEDVIKLYMRGQRDIDRMALLCFLMFFSSDAEIPEGQQLSVERMNTILRRCGYSQLDMKNDFDSAVADYLCRGTEAWTDVLAEALLDAAKNGENSYLYHFYAESGHFESELEKVMLPKA